MIGFSLEVNEGISSNLSIKSKQDIKSFKLLFPKKLFLPYKYVLSHIKLLKKLNYLLYHKDKKILLPPPIVSLFFILTP